MVSLFPLAYLFLGHFSMLQLCRSTLISAYFWQCFCSDKGCFPHVLYSGTLPKSFLQVINGTLSVVSILRYTSVQLFVFQCYIDLYLLFVVVLVFIYPRVQKGFLRLILLAVNTFRTKITGHFLLFIFGAKIYLASIITYTSIFISLFALYGLFSSFLHYTMYIFMLLSFLSL